MKNALILNKSYINPTDDALDLAWDICDLTSIYKTRMSNEEIKALINLVTVLHQDTISDGYWILSSFYRQQDPLLTIYYALKTIAIATNLKQVETAKVNLAYAYAMIGQKEKAWQFLNQISKSFFSKEYYDSIVTQILELTGEYEKINKIATTLGTPNTVESDSVLNYTKQERNFRDLQYRLLKAGKTSQENYLRELAHHVNCMFEIEDMIVNYILNYDYIGLSEYLSIQPEKYIELAQQLMTRLGRKNDQSYFRKLVYKKGKKG